ncbi:acyltransferase family protein [Cupriavidus campinensis]|uniref:Acyltransferase n=1 Tax=Cupriavidus campinensis TaxID=151783 RepID=A0AAE9L1L6_9BURK|nr:acyltransferase [Cupriavidus campinensis]URF03419.1 acyltransferase [Cupriavidus campinensis]
MQSNLTQPLPALARGQGGPTTQDASQSQVRIGGLDELRGLSILWVMICHGTVLWQWMPSTFSGYGFHGVVLFFIISGYLITRILVNGRGQDNYLSHFYVNRFFRIWPLMLVALGVSAICWPAFAKAGFYNLLMVNNYSYAVGIEPMMRTDVMWSLAIEEQFYMFWPLVALLCAPRFLPLVAAAIVMAGLGFDAGLLPTGRMIIFKATHGNMQYIAMGALVAFGTTGLRYLLSAWALFFAWWCLKHGVSHLVDFRWIWWGVTFVLALVVHYTVNKGPLFRMAFLAETGKLCYGLYIIHFFISWMVLEFIGRGDWWQGLLYLSVSGVLAVLSFHGFEKPMLNMRRHFVASDRLRAALFGAVGLTALVSVVNIVITVGRTQGH